MNDVIPIRAHPAHAARPALCRAAKRQKFVSGKTSGRDRCDIRGAVDPKQGNARMIEAPTVDAWRRIALSTAIAIMDPFKWRNSGVFRERQTPSCRQGDGMAKFKTPG